MGQVGLSRRGARDAGCTAQALVPRRSPLPAPGTFQTFPHPSHPCPSAMPFNGSAGAQEDTVPPPSEGRLGDRVAPAAAASYPPCQTHQQARTNLLSPPARPPSPPAKAHGHPPLPAPTRQPRRPAPSFLQAPPLPGPAPPPLAPLPHSREAQAPAGREGAALPQAAGSGPPRSARELTAWRGGAGAWRRGPARGPHSGSRGGSPSPPAPASASRAPPAPAGCPGSAVALPCCASPCWAEAGSGGAGRGAVSARRRQGAPRAALRLRARLPEPRAPSLGTRRWGALVWVQATPPLVDGLPSQAPQTA